MVICDFGKFGTAFVETPSVMTEREVVEGILHGQYDRPLGVIAFDVDEGWSRDVSEDIAGLVVEKARAEERTMPEGARAFVEKHLDEELEPERCAQTNG